MPTLPPPACAPAPRLRGRSPLPRGLILATALCSALLAACATAPAPDASNAAKPAGGLLEPNANLVAQGIPPVPVSLVRQVEKYTDFRGHGFVDWHPAKREMLVSHRAAGSSVNHIFRLSGPMAEPEPLTTGADRVSGASYEPKAGRYVVYSRDTGGNEVFQLYRLDLPSKTSTLLTNPDERHSFEGWFNQSPRLLYSSVPLDRTAAGGTRASVSVTLYAMNAEDPASRTKVAELPGPGWNAGELSKDDRTLLLTRYLSVNESEVWLLDMSTGERRRILPAPGSNEKGVHFATDWMPDG